MAREIEKLANAAESAEKSAEKAVVGTAQAGERAASSAVGAGEEASTSAMRAGEQAASSAMRTGEQFAGVAASQVDAMSKAGGGAMQAAFKAVQDYNVKLIQVFQTNAQANLTLGQTLMQARTASDVIDTMSRSMRERTDLVVDQTKELAALRQEATRCVMQAIAPGR